MNNANLHETLKEYCKTVTTLLKKQINPADLPVKDEPEVTEFGQGGFSLGAVKKADWDRFMVTIEEELWELESYQRALQAMTDDQRIAKHIDTLVGTPVTQWRIDGPQYLRWFVTQLLMEQQGFDFQESMFQKVYEGFEDFFYRDTIEYRVVAPLHNFTMEAERVEISPKFFIIKIPIEERARMYAKWSGSVSNLMHNPHHLAPWKQFALEIYVEAPKIFGAPAAPPVEDAPLSEARRAFDGVCATLRLFKNGAVFYAEYGMEPTSWIAPGGNRAWPGPGAPGYLYGSSYTLSADEAPKFLEFMKSPLKDLMEKRKSIRLAFNRLNFGYERLRSEDRLIDFMIGLEALFLGDGEKDELSYRLSLRAAALLGDTPENRERIFNELRMAYGVRSIIAHGDELNKPIKIGGTQISFAELVNRVEEYLRSAIREFLVRCEHQSESQVRKMLDQNIARGFPATP